MAHFFFNLSSKDRYIPDPKGRELGDVAAAHRHAMLLIHKMVSLHDADWRGWSISVTDTMDQPVLSVLFPQPGSFDGNNPRYLTRSANL